jgi:hypothetical protein
LTTCRTALVHGTLIGNIELENFERKVRFPGIRVDEASALQVAHRGKDPVSAAGHLQRGVFPIPELHPVIKATAI